MKNRLLIFSLLAVCIGMVSCTVTKSPAEIVYDTLLHRQAVEAVNQGRFVLEGYELTFSRGGMADVDENVNFISVGPDLVTIQTAFNNGRSGANGLGGLTLEGHPSKARISTDRRGNLNYSAEASGFLSARIEITLYKDSNEAVATISPTFSSNMMTMRGVILPTEKATMIKGMVTP